MTTYPSTTQSTTLWHQQHHRDMIPSSHSQLTIPILVHYTKPAEPLPLSHYGPPVHTTNSPISTQSSPTPAPATVQYKQYGVVHRTQLPHLVTVAPHIQNTSIPSEEFVPVHHGIVEHCQYTTQDNMIFAPFVLLIHFCVKNSKRFLLILYQHFTTIIS